jgi:hypothetical protein
MKRSGGDGGVRWMSLWEEAGKQGAEWVAVGLGPWGRRLHEGKDRARGRERPTAKERQVVRRGAQNIR